MVKFRFAAECLHIAVFCKLPFLAAGVAGEVNALALGFALLITVGAFIKHAVKVVCSEGLSDFNLIFLLPTEIIKGELFFDDAVDFVTAHSFDFLGREHIFNLCADLNLAKLKVVIKRVAGKGSVGADNNKRDFKALDTFAQ